MIERSEDYRQGWLHAMRGGVLVLSSERPVSHDFKEGFMAAFCDTASDAIEL